MLQSGNLIVFFQRERCMSQHHCSPASLGLGFTSLSALDPSSQLCTLQPERRQLRAAARGGCSTRPLSGHRLSTHEDRGPALHSSLWSSHAPGSLSLSLFWLFSLFTGHSPSSMLSALRFLISTQGPHFRQCPWRPWLRNNSPVLRTRIESGAFYREHLSRQQFYIFGDEYFDDLINIQSLQ